MGMALTSCTVPAAGRPTFDLPEGEMEIGIGIHGEPGRRRVPVAPAREVAEMLVEPVLADLDFTGSDGVLAFVNGMGGTPLIELYVMYAEVAAHPRARRRDGRPLAGRPYITSLDMAGCSVTLLRAGRRARPAVGRAGAHARPALGRLSRGARSTSTPALAPGSREFAPAWSPSSATRLTELDSAIGDADHGANLDRGMSAVVAALAATPPGRRRPRCSRRSA